MAKKIYASVEEFIKDRGFGLVDFDPNKPKYYTKGDMEKCWEAAQESAAAAAADAKLDKKEDADNKR